MGVWDKMCQDEIPDNNQPFVPEIKHLDLVRGTASLIGEIQAIISSKLSSIRLCAAKRAHQVDPFPTLHQAARFLAAAAVQHGGTRGLVFYSWPLCGL